MGSVLGLVLAASVAPGALAAAPSIFRDGGSFSGPSAGWTSACGFPVSLSEVSRFTVMDRGADGYDVHVNTHRTLVGPGGSVDVVAAYSFRARQPTESFVDPDTGLYTEIYRETYRGTFFMRSGGVVFKVAGSLYAKVTIAYPDAGDPIVTVEDVTAHGIQPNDAWGLSATDQAAICELLG
jgi:hypothetical protein